MTVTGWSSRLGSGRPPVCRCQPTSDMEALDLFV